MNIYVGTGLIDELLKESYDPVTKEPLGCWNTINTDNEPESRDAERCLFDLKAQTYQSKILTTFIDMVDSSKIRLLEKRSEPDFMVKTDGDIHSKVLPFVQTDLLIEEISNLKLKHLPSGNLAVEKVVSALNKDRFSALSYLLFYINEFENFIKESKEVNINALISLARKPVIR